MDVRREGNYSVCGSQPARDHRSMHKKWSLVASRVMGILAPTLSAWKIQRRKAKCPLFQGLGLNACGIKDPHVILETNDLCLIPFYYNYQPFSPLHTVMG